MENNEDIWAPTEVEIQRDAWFKEHYKTGMSIEEFWRLNAEAARLFPITARERRRKTAHLMSLPEFTF